MPVAWLSTSARPAKSLFVCIEIKIKDTARVDYFILTVKPLDLEHDRNILGRSRLCEIYTGDFNGLGHYALK